MKEREGVLEIAVSQCQCKGAQPKQRERGRPFLPLFDRERVPSSKPVYSVSPDHVMFPITRIPANIS